MGLVNLEEISFQSRFVSFSSSRLTFPKLGVISYTFEFFRNPYFYQMCKTKNTSVLSFLRSYGNGAVQKVIGKILEFGKNISTNTKFYLELDRILILLATERIKLFRFRETRKMIKERCLLLDILSAG